MSQRDELLVQLRVKVATQNTASTAEEKFQNEVLRPCIKTQSDILLLFLKTHLVTLDPLFSKKEKNKRDIFIHQLLQKDKPFSKQCCGIVVGLFTQHELETYLSMRIAMDKRIVNMVRERFLSLESSLWK